MELEKISQALKEAAEKIDAFNSSVEEKSCYDMTQEYIRNNKLEVLAEEITDAIRFGFRIGIEQERAGKFKRLEND